MGLSNKNVPRETFLLLRPAERTCVMDGGTDALGHHKSCVLTFDSTKIEAVRQHLKEQQGWAG